MNHQITRNHDSACQRHQCHPATAQNQAGKQHPKPDPQLLLERASGPQRQAIARRVIVVGQTIAIDEEGNASGHANAASLDQLSKGPFGPDIGGRSRGRSVGRARLW